VRQASGVLPGVGSISISGLAPSVSQTASQSAAPVTGAVSLTGFAPDVAQSGQVRGGGYYETKRKRVNVIKDDREERAAEFERLLKVVTGQAETKAKDAAQKTPVIDIPSEIKAPRMPEVRGVDSSVLRLWMPDLLQTFKDTYRNVYAEQMAKRRAEDEELELITLLLL